MNPYFTAHSPLARRATVPITAPMLDANLSQFSLNDIQHQQLMRTHTGSHIENPPMQTQLQPHVQNHRSLQSPLQANAHQPMRMQHVDLFPASPVQANPQQISERILPSKQITEQTIEDAYVKFILYCNLFIPSDVETAELRKGFCNPPRSDGKSFSPYTLFQLLSRFENKEGINTWTQLVMELGVEPPDQEKGQSTQKVQQYAVRLKRWLHAFHVDAFFNYLLGKPSSYQTERPSALASIPETSREGIPPEEDLALRALLPEWRPKRGRRKAEETEADVEADSANKRQSVRDSSGEFTSIFEDQYSAAPSSAAPWSSQQRDPVDLWAAAQVAIAPKEPLSAPAHGMNRQGPIRPAPWRANDTSMTPYPQSAITARQAYSASPALDEPSSARPASSTMSASKSPSRARRRPGSAVSSAWPSSTQSGTAAKIRGRPPSNRSVQDGPFSTFPVNPNANDSSSTMTTPQQTTLTIADASLQSSQPPMTTTTSPPKIHNSTLDHTVRKPSKLQLQVPPHPGGPVRLATPPQVLINGATGQAAPTVSHDRRASADFFSHLDGISEEDGVEGQAEGSVGSDDLGGVGGGGGTEAAGTKDEWRRRALVLKRKLAEKEEELKAVKRRVLEAVM